MFFYEGTNYMKEDYYQAFFLTKSSFPLHFHRAFELIHLLKGEMSVFIEEKEYHLVPGDLAFVFPEQLHAIYSPISSRITIIQFSPELTGHFSTRYQKQIPVDPILSGVFYPADRLQFTNVYEKKSFLYYLCALLTAHTDFIPLSNHTTPPFCLLSYVGQHFQQECSLIEAAKASGYDYSYLSRTFKKKTGISFTEYVNQYRISQAAYLLSNTTDSISSIAFACGFNTIRSFNRNFKELIGVPPGEYRKSVPKSTMDNQPEIFSILSCQSL